VKASTKDGFANGRVRVVSAIAHNQGVARIKSRQTISRETRRDISDALLEHGIHYSGTKEEPAFLGRIWDLSELRSTDRRYSDAAGDIYQHTVNNPQDWDPDLARGQSG
jgi:hypothetical protein